MRRGRSPVDTVLYNLSMPQRDEEFTAFVRARGPALARTACFLAGDVTRGEDLLQSALAATYVRWRSMPDIESLEAYVRRALVRSNAAWWRRRVSSELPVDVLPDRAVADATEGVVERDALMAALRRLPARQRAAVVLRFYDDLSEARTAELLGCSAGSVKQHTSRGLARLRELLPEPEEAPCP